MKVFRYSWGVRRAVGLVTVGIAVAMFYVWSFAVSNGSGQVAGVDFCITLLATTAVVGLLSIPAAILWFTRVEMDERQIRCYNWLNRPVFGALWSQLQRYGRYGVEWRMGADNWSFALRNINAFPGLQAEMLRRLPPEVQLVRQQPQIAPGNDRKPLAIQGGRAVDLGAVILFPVFLFGMLCGLLFLVEGRREAAAWIPFAAVGLIFAGAAQFLWMLWLQSLSRIMRGRLQVDSGGIVYDDGSGPVTMAWDEVRAIVAPPPLDVAPVLLLVSADREIRITGGFDDFAEVTRQSIARSPDDTTVFG